jgi:hypothetical protein
VLVHPTLDTLERLEDARDRVGHFRQGELLPDADPWSTWDRRSNF